jgi:hypothetical protein
MKRKGAVERAASLTATARRLVAKARAIRQEARRAVIRARAQIIVRKVLAKKR